MGMRIAKATCAMFSLPLTLVALSAMVSCVLWAINQELKS